MVKRAIEGLTLSSGEMNVADDLCLRAYYGGRLQTLLNSDWLEIRHLKRNRFDDLQIVNAFPYRGDKSDIVE